MKYIINMENEKELQEYEEFTANHPNGCFMQSIHWADVKAGWQSEAIMVKDDSGKIKGTALILIKKIAVINSSFLYCPHGPVCDYNDIETMRELLDAIGEIAEKYNAYQLKIDPCITENDKLEIDAFKSLGFTYKENAPELSTIQARNNYMLFFNGRSKDELFAAFHKKWRYNIRVAEKHGVVCKVCGKEALDDFYPLMVETGKRDGFCIRKRSYFEKMMDSLGESCRLYICYLSGVPLSGAICVRYAGKSCYVYGASTIRLRNVMPNYLMQWNMICDAVDSGCIVHDFQGIPFYTDEKHPNYGVYRFKKGFNGEVVTYAGEFDLCYKRTKKRLSDIAYRIRGKLRRAHTLMILHKSGKKNS